MQPSPYTPGEIARGVPGRSTQLGEFDERLSYLVDLKRFVGRIRVDFGPRGYGKTSLLRQYELRARSRGVLTAWVTAGERSGLVLQLADSISRATQSWKSGQRSKILRSVQSVTMSVGVPGIAKVDAKLGAGRIGQPPAGARELEDLIRTAAAGKDGTGLVILIDEIQTADFDGLRTLAYAWQHLQAEGADVPAAVMAAGLPNAPEVIASAVTFSERLAYRPLHLLSIEAAEIAILEPSHRLGVRWEPAALHQAIDLAAGYPYTVQLIADASWVAADRPGPGTMIRSHHVQAARASVQQDLAALFRARWANATPREQELMAAMADLGDGPVRRAEVATRIGTTAESLGVPRARLIDKGFIQAASRGTLEFTIPGFAEFIRTIESRNDDR